MLRLLIQTHCLKAKPAGTAAILSRRTTQTCTDTHMDTWRSLSELRRQRCGGRSGHELIPTDPSHMDQCLVFNCSETPINHPCVCVCVLSSLLLRAVYISAAWTRSQAATCRSSFTPCSQLFNTELREAQRPRRRGGLPYLSVYLIPTQ